MPSNIGVDVGTGLTIVVPYSLLTAGNLHGSNAAQQLKNALSRVTSSGRFIPQIDGLRFVAIVSVLLFHSYSYYWPTGNPDASGWAFDGANWLVHRGWFGVQLFFAISGFILPLPFAEHYLNGHRPVELKRYFVRRLTRLEPPYIIHLLLVVLIFASWSEPGMIRHFLASITYTHFAFFGEPSTLNRILWSLEIEVQFYITAPLLFQLFRLRSAWLRRGLLVAAMVTAVLALPYGHRWIPWWEFNVIKQTLLGQISWFLAGLLLADLYVCRWKKCEKRLWRWDILGVLSWAGTIALIGRLDLPVAFLPLMVFGACAGALRGRLLSRVLAWPLLTVIGGMCYTIYLYHNILLPHVNHLAHGVLAGAAVIGEVLGLSADGAGWAAAEMIVRAVVLLAGVVAVSAVGFLLFEKPFMQRDWPRRFSHWLRRRRWRRPGDR
ncbi:MAG: acyltransferase family protein [Planctomycetota bacterium]|jgi:peptidoglycan/LPS O-acetylase OafA/YrhL